MLKGMKAATYRLPVPVRSYGSIGRVLFLFPPRRRSTLRLAGSRYYRVTVKLSVLLTQPCI